MSGFLALRKDRSLPVAAGDVGLHEADVVARLGLDFAGRPGERFFVSGDEGDSRALAGERKSRGTTETLASPANQCATPANAEVHRREPYPATANEPASRREGTRKRPATSFSCSRSVMISASSPLTSTVAGRSCAL